MHGAAAQARTGIAQHSRQPCNEYACMHAAAQAVTEAHAHSLVLGFLSPFPPPHIRCKANGMLSVLTHHPLARRGVVAGCRLLRQARDEKGK